MNLHRWIRRNPVPVALMCGETRIVIGTAHRRWQDAIDGIFATNSEQIVAVDAKGAVLRVCQRSDIDDAPVAVDDTAQEGISEHQRELAQISQIVADAYSTAHDHARENSARGYELLAKFAELSFGRLAAIEKAYGQLLAAHARAIESDSSSNDMLDGAISGVIKQAVMGDAPKPTAVSNGKKEVAQ
jgi:hypothetical protein